MRGKMFNKKAKEAPRDPATYGEGLLIVACKKFELRLIKEHFADEIRYIMYNGDVLVYKGSWYNSMWALDTASIALEGLYAWAKKNNLGIRSEVLVP
jgi:hypothetical protein